MEYFVDSFDVAVIGAGHAGIEAALAAARLGQKTIIFTISLDAVGNMPCNPSIGGTAKGHLVREIDALGGEMGRAADKVFLQSRMLNRGKGPAVHSLRIQADRRKYQEVMKETLEKEKNLVLKQAEIKKNRKKSRRGLFSLHSPRSDFFCSGGDNRYRNLFGGKNNCRRYFLFRGAGRHVRGDGSFRESESFRA